MTAAKDFRPKSAPAAIAVNFFMGTNANGKHLEEAMHQQIIRGGEQLLGFFDGIFFEEGGKRVGGLALNDYLIVTDQCVILWARDQFKDYVDRFELADCRVVATEQKDLLHGTLHLECALPDGKAGDELDELDDSSKIEVIFDFVPLADLKQVAEVLEVAGNVHRDLLAGGASMADRRKATWILFNQVFVQPQQGRGADLPFAANFGADYDQDVTEEAEENPFLDEIMTPLSRLDALDGGGIPAPRPLRPTGQPTLKPLPRPAARSGYGAADGGGELGDLAAELEWLNAGSSPAGTHHKADARQKFFESAGPVPPGQRLKQDLNPDGLYNIGRAGRAAWDGLDKLRREAEARVELPGANVLPLLRSLRESGMNLHDITEFVVAVNELLDTVQRSPAAHDIIMNFLNRSALVNNPAPAKPEPSRSRRRPMVEEVPINDEEDAPAAPPRSAHATPLKVERRPKAQKVAIQRSSEPASLDLDAELASDLPPEVQPEPAPVEEIKPAEGSPLFGAPASSGGENHSVRLVRVRSNSHEVKNN